MTPVLSTNFILTAVILHTFYVKFWIDVLLEAANVGSELKQKADQIDLDEIKAGMEKLNLGNTYFSKRNIK